jgi:hypothetical protein
MVPMRQIPPSALFKAEVGSTTQFREYRAGGVLDTAAVAMP